MQQLKKLFKQNLYWWHYVSNDEREQEIFLKVYQRAFGTFFFLIIFFCYYSILNNHPSSSGALFETFFLKYFHLSFSVIYIWFSALCSILLGGRIISKQDLALNQTFSKISLINGAGNLWIASSVTYLVYFLLFTLHL